MILSLVSKSAATSRVTLLVAGLFLCAWSSAHAGDFSVSPIRAELKSGNMSETVTVTNHSDKPMRVSVRLMQWTQDAEAKDVLTDSSDLVYFPRQLELEPGARRLVRVGAKNPAGPVERTYRLFIEEVPPPQGGEQSGTQVQVFFKFGLPIFMPPAVPKVAAEVSEPVLRKGQLAFDVRNTGNQHFRLTKIRVDDGAGFSLDVGGWYTLAGVSRTYTAQIPLEVCRKASRLVVSGEGDGVRFERALEVSPPSCL